MSKNISPDTIIGPYRVVSQIGAGGMGEVYLAEDSRLHRKVALKILPAEMAANHDRMRRFKQEATAAAAARRAEGFEPSPLTCQTIGAYAGTLYDEHQMRTLNSEKE